LEYVIPGDQVLRIDTCEEYLLKVNYEVMRDACASHLRRVSKREGYSERV
jgi:hypothetical protein